jgi:hypothetical protein
VAAVRRHAATIAAAAVAVGAAALLLIASRGSWFYLDEWDFATRAVQLSAETIFYPQNQNCHATVVLVYRAMFELFGFNDYLPFRLLMILLVIGVGLLGYVYARRRIGPWWALLPLGLLVASPSYEVMLWPFQIGQLLSAAAGLGALLLLERGATRRNLGVAAALLVVAVMSSSVGVPLVALVVYDRLLTPGRRREVLVALPAVAAYGWWYAEYSTREPRPNEFTAAALNTAARRTVDIGDGVVQSLLGLGSRGATGALIAQIGLVVLVVLVCWRVFGPYSKGRGRVIALAGALVTYWFLLAWGRPSQAGIEISGRYLFLSQILILLLLVEVATGVADWLRDERVRRPQPVRVGGVVAAGALVVVAGLALIHNARTELDFGGTLRQNARAMRGQVYALFLLPDDRRATATVYLEALGSQIPRSSSQLFQVFDSFGGPTVSEADVKALPADARQRTDQALFANYVTPVATPPGAGAPPSVTVLGGEGARQRTAGSCETIRARPGGRALVAVGAPQGGFSIANIGATPLTIQGRRYASGWDGPARADVAPKTSLTVSLPADRGTAPWRLRAAGEGMRLCALGA